MNLALPAPPLLVVAGLDVTGPLLLLALAAAVALATRLVRVSYTVALVFVGLMIGLSTRANELLDVPSDRLIPDLIFFVLLPPLLFEGCLHIDLDIFWRRARFILLMAFLGTTLTALIVGGAVYAWLGEPLLLTFLPALLIGVIVAPTDPVSVLALFKEVGVDRELSITVEGESVLNDGVGVVLFLILLSILSGREMSVAQGAGLFLWEVGGGALIGIVLGYLTYRLLGLVDDHLVEVVISLVLAYGSYVVAAQMHASGVLSVVFAGLIIGNYGTLFSMSPTTRINLMVFWETLAFLANSVLFLLIGLKLDPSQMVRYGLPIVGIFIVGTLARGVSVAVCAGLSRLLGSRLPWRWGVASWWGGVRGSIPIAMALGLVGGTGQLTGFLVDEIVGIVFGFVFLSLVLQTLTMKPVLARLGLSTRSPEQDAYERGLGRSISLRAGLETLDALWSQREISDAVYQEVHDTLVVRNEQVLAETQALLEAHRALHDRELARVSDDILYAQRAAIDMAAERGLLSERVRGELAREIDAQLGGALHEAFEADEDEEGER